MTDEPGTEAEETEVEETTSTARPLPEDELLRGLVEPFDDAAWELSHGQDVVRLPRERWAEFAQSAAGAGFDMCTDVTAVDWFRKRPVRFEVVANIVSVEHARRLRMITDVPRDDPTVASLCAVWPGANFAEREVFDMFGIRFEGHPDLTRILMPDEWEGHPLRKDFGVGSVPVQFKGSHKVS